MAGQSSFGRHLAHLAASMLARASEMMLGVVCIAVGLALAVTIYLMPLGALLALLGVVLFISGSNAAEALWTHLRQDYDARHHVAIPNGSHAHSNAGH